MLNPDERLRVQNAYKGAKRALEHGFDLTQQPRHGDEANAAEAAHYQLDQVLEGVKQIQDILEPMWVAAVKPDKGKGKNDVKPDTKRKDSGKSGMNVLDPIAPYKPE